MFSHSGEAGHHHDGNHSCCASQTAGSVQQSLSEMDFERGIWTAALDGDEERVRKMLSQGTHPDSVDASGYTALHYASRNGHKGVCRTLLAKGANVNKTTRSGGATALHRASYCGHTSVVTLLLQRRADPSIIDGDGRTALHKAAEKGNITVLQHLISTCQDAKMIKDNRGRIPLDCYRGQEEAIRNLLQT